MITSAYEAGLGLTRERQRAALNAILEGWTGGHRQCIQELPSRDKHL